MLELAPRPKDLAWLLSDLATRLPGTRGVLLLSTDGLVKAAHNLDTDAADHMAALASGLHSLARSTGHHLAHGSPVRHLTIELETALLFITPAGNGTCLAVLTRHDTDPALIHHHMTALVTSVHPHLTTPGRTGEDSAIPREP